MKASSYFEQEKGHCLKDVGQLIKAPTWLQCYGFKGYGEGPFQEDITVCVPKTTNPGQQCGLWVSIYYTVWWQLLQLPRAHPVCAPLGEFLIQSLGQEHLVSEPFDQPFVGLSS